MKQLVSPSPIDVKVPRYDDPGSTHDVNMHTALFRVGSYLAEALDAAVERAENPESLKVASAACSIGAEADGLLALHRQGGYEGEVILNGYDINELALAAARQGLYRIKGTDAQNLEKVKEVLEELGFAASYVPYDLNGPERSAKIRQARLMGMRPPLHELDTELVADSAGLREGHQVNFHSHNLHYPLPEPGQDLIVANNLLYHLEDREAIGVSRSLAASLSENGVLSFGNGTLHEPVWWVERMIDVLRTDFQLEPIVTDARYGDSVPVMFGRT